MGLEDRETGLALTLADYAAWMLKCAGTAGRKNAAAVITKALSAA
jgi:hypothetical protein